MKNIIKCFLAFTFISALLISSCTKDFENINTDPNNINKVVPGALMAPILYDMATFSSSRNYSFTWQLMQVGFPYPATATGVHRYDITPTAGNSTWNKGYSWLRTISEIRNSAEEIDLPVYQAVSNTLEAYATAMLTDAFGDVPYTEAIKLDDGISMPVFDAQEDIYKSLINSLEEANSIYKDTESVMTGNDILFNNDKHKWRKFNNSLLMRLLLRVSKKSEMDSYNRIKKMLDDPVNYPVFNNNEEAAILKVNGQSPFEYAWSRRQDYTLNITTAEFFVDLLNSYDDPRRPLFMNVATTIPEGDTIGYKGIPAAHEPTAAFMFNPSIPNADLMVPELGTVIHEIIMSYAEVEFIKSEVYLKFGELDKAEDAYKKGTIAGITQWFAEKKKLDDFESEFDFDAYFNNPLVAFDATLERIMNQKYLALYMCDYQQWFEYRRTGYPKLPKTEFMLNDGEMPKRFMYHDKLSVTNPDNYKAASEKMDKGDSPLSKVWWEK